MDLFDSAKKGRSEPLASRMRPRNLDEYIGQDHIVGKGRLLRRAIATDQLTSVIFYGPPGTGKTTLARVIANHTKSNFITLNAVLTGVQNIRDSIAQAEQFHHLYDKKTILFVDEVHRWNRSQQDALLPWVENGTIILVGATTENPFFEVNKALVSRSRIFQLKPLTEDDLAKAAKMALSDKERGYGRWDVQFQEGALEHLIQTANGDARSLLNALELAVETTPEKWNPDGIPSEPKDGEIIYVSQETAEESIQQKVVLYDRDGDYHYDVISAFIKSIRGSDPDAALYWLARMISAGESPHFIFRRLLISACEDIGLADPNALNVVQSAAAAFDRIGLPEGRYMLTQAVLYLATAPKSNSSMAFFDALKIVQNEDKEVPNHLRDASRDGEGFAHGDGYLYPHAYKDHWVAQQYLPDGINGRVFYNPGNQGYEKTIREEVLSRRELQISSLLEQISNQDEILNISGVKIPENLTFSPNGNQRESWQKRTDSNRSHVLLEIRNAIMKSIAIPRHSCNLVMGADDGLLLWDLWRKSPEGCTAGVCKSERGKEILSQYAKTLDDLEKPLLCCVSDKDDINSQTIRAFDNIKFDFVFYRDPVTARNVISTVCEQISSLCKSKIISENATIIISQRLTIKTQRISKLIEDNLCESKKIEYKEVIADFCNAENDFFQGKELGWTVNELTENIKNAFTKNGFFKTTITTTECSFTESRQIDNYQIDNWFNSSISSYGKAVFDSLGSEKFNLVKHLISEISQNQRINWIIPICILHITNKDIQ